MDKTLISVLAGLGGMFGWGTSDFLASRSTEHIGYLKTFFWSQLIGLIAICFIVPFFGITFQFSLVMVGLLLLASMFYSAAYLLFYRAFEIGNVSVVSSTINLYAVCTMIFSYIFLGQRLTQMQIIAIICILSGVTLVSLNFNDIVNGKIRVLLGVKETLLSSLIFGIFWTISDVIAGQTGWVVMTIGVKMGTLLTLLLYSSLTKQTLTVGNVKIKTKYIFIGVGLLEVIGMASVNFGLTIGDAILITPISTALSVVTISLAVLFLKEKLSKLQVVGIVTTLVGIVMTAL